MIVKLITLNLNHGGELIENILDFIRQESPHVLLVQEAYDSENLTLEKRFRSIQVLKQVMETEDSAFLPAYFDGDVQVDRGNGIISVLPLKNSGGQVFNSEYRTIKDEASLGDWSDQPRVIQTAEVIVGDTRLNLINVHGLWDVHGRDSEKRLKQSELILKYAENKKSLLIAGDFNMNPDTDAMHMISRQYKPVFHDIRTTFNMKRKANPDFGQAVVDMIYVSDDIKIIRNSCLEVDISDHLPLVVEIEI